MAEDKLIFPIGFDLEKGVKEAEKNADEYLRRIENAIKKHPISVKMQLEQESKLSSTVKAETQRAAKELTGLKKEMAEINKAWNELSAKDRGGEVGARLIAEYRALTQEAKGYTSTIGAAVKLEDRLARQREKTAEAATKAAKKTNSSYDEQLSYLSKLLTKMAAVWSVNLVKRFITGIREVTAEFELQRVSLGAIIQDQNRANQLFSEIKTFALKSPVSIMDLTKYTKQLAAYKIETNSLFDTTKRLADVSVGLGVSMDRLILAFGQVKAASYLRSAEIRQFTEAGIPMLELLAEKFTAIQGKAVTTEQVMDMVSKRAVSFSMVEEIFKDMTDAGGMFYNMQETQGNTLFGLWAKLGDAASVMYDQIGNTDFVNKGMKSSIQLLTELMRNWRAVSKTAIFAGLPSAAIASLYKYSTATTRVSAAQSAVENAVKRREEATLQLSNAIKKESVDDINAANAALEKAQADEVAAKKGLSRMGLMKSGFTSLAKSFASGLGIGLLITAATTLVYKFFEAWENAHRLKNTINEIDAERIRLSNQSVRNFTHLADVAVKAADGSKKQKDALNELHRTYKDMIPVQDLTIDRLRAMHGNYTMLTDAIREYINEQQKQKALSAIQEEFGGKQQTAMRKLYDWFDDQGLSSNERERFFREFEKQAEDTSKSLKEKIVAAFDAAGIEGGEKLAKSIIKEKGFWNKVFGDSLSSSIITAPTYYLYRKIFPDKSYINDLNKAIAGYNKETQAVLESYDKASGELGEFKKVMDDVAKAQTDVVYKDNKGEILDDNSYQKQQMQINRNIKAFANKIRNDKTFKKAFQKIEVDIQDQWFDIVDKLNENDLGHISSIQFDAIIKAAEGKHPQLEKALKMWQDEYNNMVPSDVGVQVVRAKFVEIANEMGPKFIDRVKSGLMGATESLKDYRKRIEDTVNDLAVSIKSLNAELVMTPVYDVMKRSILGVDLKDAEELKAHYDKILAMLPDFSKTTGGGGSDPRLGVLQEMVSSLKNINKEYDDLAKKKGATKALADTQRVYADTFKNMQSLAKKYKFKLPEFGVPTDAATLTKYLDAIRVQMKKLPKSDKAVLSLQVDIDKIDIAVQQEKIEKQLKELADRISRTKTAKEFYDKVLGMTGDYELAAKFSMSIYGGNGSELKEQIKQQFETAFEGLKGDHADIMPKVTEIIDRGAYEELRDYIALLPEEQRKAAEDLVKAQQQMSAKQIETWLKDLEKTKTFADKRIELARYTANQIAAIEERIAKLDPAAADYEQQKAMLEKIIAGYRNREDKEAAKLEYEAFKDTPLYIQMFEDLEHASTSTLESMKQKLLSMHSVWGSALDPTQLKEMQSRLNEIDTQLRERNPFKSLKEAYISYKDTVKDYSISGAEANVATAQSNYEKEVKDTGAGSKEAIAAKKTLDIEKQRLEIARQLTDEKGKQLTGQKAIDLAAQIANEREAQARVDLAQAEASYQQAIKDSGSPESEAAKAAYDVVEQKKEALNLAQQTSEVVQQDATASKKLKESFIAAGNQIVKGLNMAGDLAAGIGKMTEVFGGSEEDVQYWNDMSDALGEISSGIGDVVQAAMQGNPMAVVSGVITAIPKMFSGFANLFSAGKVRRANKEIKKQQKILDQLEYSYGRLEKAAEKAFGGDYIKNFKDQQANLQAQIEATQKQLAAEQSKGKKTDDAKVKEYQEKIRDLKDQLADMQDELANYFAGTDITSAARDFANAWIEAKTSFEDTTEAMRENFSQMIQNMIVEAMAASVMKQALEPFYKALDDAAEDGTFDVNELVNAANIAYDQIGVANDAMEVMWETLKAKGLDVTKIFGNGAKELTGISRDIAGASEESINGLAATMNTWSYYVSYVPQIAQNVAALRAILEGGVAPIQSGQGVTDLITLQNQSLTHLQAINQHTAETVTECQRIAERCTAMAEDIHRVVVPKGTKGSYSMQVQM